MEKLADRGTATTRISIHCMKREGARQEAGATLVTVAKDVNPGRVQWRT
jgi:hypothetical protein